MGRMGLKRGRKNHVSRAAKRSRYNTIQKRSNHRVGGFLGIEKKFYDTSLLEANLVTTGDCTLGLHNPSAVITLNTVPQGSGEQERDGRKISMKYLSISGLVRQNTIPNTTSFPQQGGYFIAVVLDTQANGAIMKSEDVFKNQSANISLAINPFRNLEKQARFKVLKTVRGKMGLPSAAYSGTGNNSMALSGVAEFFSININLKDLPCLFSGATANISDIVNNSLNLVVFIYDKGAAIYVLNYNARLRYVG